METYHFKTLPPPCREEIQDHLSTKSPLMTFLSLHFLLLFQGAAGHVALQYLCYCLMHSNGSGDFAEKARGGGGRRHMTLHSFSHLSQMGFSAQSWNMASGHDSRQFLIRSNRLPRSSRSTLWAALRLPGNCEILRVVRAEIRGATI